jgi:hypothetical protein
MVVRLFSFAHCPPRRPSQDANPQCAVGASAKRRRTRQGERSWEQSARMTGGWRQLCRSSQPGPRQGRGRRDRFRSDPLSGRGTIPTGVRTSCMVPQVISWRGICGGAEQDSQDIHENT